MSDDKKTDTENDQTIWAKLSQGSGVTAQNAQKVQAIVAAMDTKSDKSGEQKS